MHASNPGNEGTQDGACSGPNNKRERKSRGGNGGNIINRIQPG